MHMCSAVIIIVTSWLRTVEGHAYLAQPSSKNEGTINSYQLAGTDFSAYWTRMNWFVDKASLNGDPTQKPWNYPGKFNYSTAYEIAQQAFHPCGCLSPLGPQYCASVQMASGFGETTLGNSLQGPYPSITPVQWPKGSTQETAFTMYANHHGGYLYMLCKKSTFDQCKTDHLPVRIATATKAQMFAYQQCVWDCFETNVLEFLPGSQKLQYGSRNDLTVNTNVRTKGPGGTMPLGSVWREVPLPDQNQASATNSGRCNWDAIDSSTFSSNEAKQKFIADFGDAAVCDSRAANHHPKKWHIKDSLIVPASISEGEYLVSWRWDCGLADQVWSNCADVKIVAEEKTTSVRAVSSTATSTVVDTSTFTTTRTGTTPCADATLPIAWSGGGVHTCLTYQMHGGLAYCNHNELKRACCFCGGGQLSPQFASLNHNNHSYSGTGQPLVSIPHAISRSPPLSPFLVPACFCAMLLFKFPNWGPSQEDAPWALS